MSRGNYRSLWRFFAAVMAVSFRLNWLWEMLQMPAYEQMAGRSWNETAFPCARAALGDVAITLATSGLGALAAGQAWLAMKRRWNVYVAAALLGGLISLAFEEWALASGRWSYEPREAEAGVKRLATRSATPAG